MVADFAPQFGVGTSSSLIKRELPKRLCEASHLRVISEQQDNSRKVAKVNFIVFGGPVQVPAMRT